MSREYRIQEILIELVNDWYNFVLDGEPGDGVKLVQEAAKKIEAMMEEGDE